MRKFFAATVLAYSSAVSSTWAASVEGTILSVDSELRTVTMETGEIWNLSEFVALDGIEPGQIVRITYEDTTVDATAVDILEKPAEPSVTDETPGGASVE